MHSLDTDLLRGFRFDCLPDCGLCCYTTPFVVPSERARLIQLDPRTPFHPAGRTGQVVASRPEGGACYFLSDSRCRCHPARPFPCAEFPVTVHLGERIQASIVLSCPGVDLSTLASWGIGAAPTRPPEGIDRELEAVERECRRAEQDGLVDQARRRQRGLRHRLSETGQWIPPAELRAGLRNDRLWPTASDFPIADLPDTEAPAEELPLFFDPAWGRVAYRLHDLGIEFVRLRERGGIEPIGEPLPLPQAPPSVSDVGRRILLGYLGYVLLRDQSLQAVYDVAVVDHTRTLRELLEYDLHQLAARVLSLALLRRALGTRRTGPLDSEEVLAGIRASDLDWLDRPTSSFRL